MSKSTREDFHHLFTLSGEIIERYLDNKEGDFLTEHDLKAVKTLAELTQIDDRNKFITYFPNLFKEKLYNKNTKYQFIFRHLKLYKYIVKNKLELWLGENVSEEKKNILNTKFPLYRIFSYTNAIKLKHEKMMEEKPDFYKETDEEFVLIFKYFIALYKIFFRLELKTDKKVPLNDIIKWATGIVTGEPDNDELDMKKIMKDSIEKAKSMDIRAKMESMGFAIPEDFDIESLVEKAFGDDEGEGMGMINSIQNGMGMGDFNQTMAELVDDSDDEDESSFEEVIEDLD